MGKTVEKIESVEVSTKMDNEMVGISKEEYDRLKSLESIVEAAGYEQLGTVSKIGNIVQIAGKNYVISSPTVVHKCTGYREVFFEQLTEVQLKSILQTTGQTFLTLKQ